MSSRKRTVGLLTLSLRRERTDLAEEFQRNAVRALADRGIEVAGPPGLVFDTDGCLAEAKKLEGKADCILLLLGTWVFAPTVVDFLSAVDLPFGIWCEDNPGSFSLTAGGIVHGSLDELGLKHRFFYGSPQTPELVEELSQFVEAAACVRALRGERLVVVGGRVMGMYTTMADIIQVKNLFGVEIEHVDSVRVYLAAKALSSDQVEKEHQRLASRLGSINTAPGALENSIRLYLALKSVLEEEGYGIVAVKCQEEIINEYASFCLANSLLNDEGYTVSCESDINGALTMKILRELSGGVSLFGDVNHLDLPTDSLRIVNCGSMPTSMAESEREVSLENQYEYMGRAGGATTVFSVKAAPVTMARLFRLTGEYSLVAGEGDTVDFPRERFKEAREYWPHALVKMEKDSRCLVQNIRSNHMHLCFGRHLGALRELCSLKGIGLVEV